MFKLGKCLKVNFHQLAKTLWLLTNEACDVIYTLSIYFITVTPISWVVLGIGGMFCPQSCVPSRKNEKRWGCEWLWKGPDCDDLMTGQEHLQNCSSCWVFLVWNDQSFCPRKEKCPTTYKATSGPRLVAVCGSKGWPMGSHLSVNHSLLWIGPGTCPGPFPLLKVYSGHECIRTGSCINRRGLLGLLNLVFSCLSLGITCTVTLVPACYFETSNLLYNNWPTLSWNWYSLKKIASFSRVIPQQQQIHRWFERHNNECLLGLKI